MKKIVILFLLLQSSIHNYSQEKNNNLPEKKTTCKAIKNYLLRAIMLSVFVINKDKFAHAIKKHPFISFFCTGICCKYAFDSYRVHQILKYDFTILALLQELYDLLLYASEISSIMTQVSVSKSRKFDSTTHFDKIVKEVPYSFDELEKKAKHMLIKWKLKIKTKYPKLYSPSASRKTTHMEDINTTICYFYERPIETYQNACTQIAQKIKIILENIQKLNLLESL